MFFMHKEITYMALLGSTQVGDCPVISRMCIMKRSKFSCKISPETIPNEGTCSSVKMVSMNQLNYPDFAQWLSVGAAASTVQGRAQMWHLNPQHGECCFQGVSPQHMLAGGITGKKKTKPVLSEKVLSHSSNQSHIPVISTTFLQALFFLLPVLSVTFCSTLSLCLLAKAISKLFNQTNMQPINNNQFGK